MERLGLRGETQRLVDALERLRMRLPQLATPDLRPSQIVAHLDDVAPAALALGYLLCDDSVIEARLAAYLSQWQSVKPLFTGKDLAALGIARGPIYSRILGAIRAARLDGDVTNRVQEETLALQLAAQSPGADEIT